MKMFLAIFFSSLALILIYGQDESPCEDSLFVELKNKPTPTLSYREYEYFITFTKRCAEYQESLALQMDTTIVAEDIKEHKSNSLDIEEFKLLIKFIGTIVLLYSWLSPL
ncbi:MAG: hypothetical protein SCARUB_05024 [Candidatus Scalindua rubra]|uniref:Uncharacterized protein n=1 Tax=Candidatus Scalindua rubra TaxID=1872076 RepID=A0A1E3X2H4_9BACT|nr:MAG: hypothetical protein SCARUB_05024 [Candidatus Scalindua rubra]